MLCCAILSHSDTTTVTIQPHTYDIHVDYVIHTTRDILYPSMSRSA